MANKSCVLQFTGGRDSTLSVLMLTEKYGFDEIHLLTFKTDLTADLHKVNTNVEKLQNYLKGKATIYHKVIETQDLLRDLVQKDYFKNLIQFRSFNASTFCPSCRLSHHVHSIIYCLQNNISNAADGINELTGYDLFQQAWAVEEVDKLYAMFNIKYHTPLLKSKVTSEQILEQYNKENNLAEPFYESQPKCLGGGQFHNLYLRCYFLPLKGIDAYKRISLKWIDSKIPMVVEHVKDHIRL